MEGETAGGVLDGAGRARDEPAVVKRAISTADRKPPAPRPVSAWLSRAGFRVGSWIPPWLAHPLGGAVGWIASWFPGRSQDATFVNLRLCLPELSEKERTRLARRSLMEDARMAIQLCGLWTWDRERVLGRVLEVVGEEHLEAARAAGKGVIIASPHLGCWEMFCLWVSTRHPMTALYRPPRIRELEAFYNHARGRFGAKLVPAGPSGVRELRRALSRGELAGILPDQDPGRGSGVFVPFFGVLANTSVLLARLAQRTGAKVLCCTAEVLPRGVGYRIRIEPASPAVSEGDPESGTRAMNAEVERMVRRTPAHYLWSYKRFRQRPHGEDSPYAKRRKRAKRRS